MMISTLPDMMSDEHDSLPDILKFSSDNARCPALIFRLVLQRFLISSASLFEFDIQIYFSRLPLLYVYSTRRVIRRAHLVS